MQMLKMDRKGNENYLQLNVEEGMNVSKGGYECE